MAVTMGELFMRNLGVLRMEPTAKRIRATLGRRTVIDTSAALLVWEPKRVVPTYAAPVGDIAADIVPVETVSASAGDFDRIPVWDPRIPFSVRTTPGHPVRIEASESGSTADGFVPDDPDLAGYVILDFDGFERWLEEDDTIISHPHSPFSRIDVRDTSKRLSFALDGITLAETNHARILFETGLPPRYYIPREDVRVELQPSDTVTSCAYKGVATYFSPQVPGAATRDLAWAYESPLIDGERVRGYVSFFDEKLDVTIDGIERPRPKTPWS